MSLPRPDIKNINNIFEDKFYIPSYQRNYSWGQNEVEDFWNDLLSLYKAKENKDDYHFFGQIVTFDDKDEKKQAIIDGQQRLTTSFIFMAAIKNIAKNRKDELKKQDKLPEDLRDGFRDIIRDADSIMNIDSMHPITDEEPSLNLQNSILKKHFSYILHNREDSINENAKQYNLAPMKNMNNAYQLFNSKLYEILKNDDIRNNINNEVLFLRNIFNYFRYEFQLSIISVPNKTDAFTIFETLNTRGKDLETSDIIKTHLMSLSSNDDEMDNFRKEWSSMADSFNQRSSEIDKFLKSYWTARQRYCGKNELYRSISQKVNSESSARQFLNDLLKLKDIYNVMTATSKSKAAINYCDNERLSYLFMDLSDMGCKLYYPIILAMKYHDFNEEDILKVTYKVLSIYIRKRIICEKGTNTIQPGFDKTAQNIWKGKFASVQSIKEGLEQINSSDLEVNDSFANLSKKIGSKNAKGSTVMYLLFKLYQDDNNYSDDYYDNSQDFKDMTLHSNKFKEYGFRVVPINPNINENEIDYSNFIGNLVLVEDGAKINQNGLSSALMNSNLQHNRNVANMINKQNGEWTVDNIKERQNSFNNLISKIWH